MKPTQIAQDYAAEMGFDVSDHEDGSVEIWHPKGAALVQPDGLVISLPNPQLKAVLEKKIGQARAEEKALTTDPTQRITIKFSSRYVKMPRNLEKDDTKLLTVLKAKVGYLSPEFLEWDTKFADKPGNFPLPAGQEFLVLLLLSRPTGEPNAAGQLWTTIRAAWPPEKEEYYRSHVGELVNIAIEGRK